MKDMRSRANEAAKAIHQLILWHGEELPDGALDGTGLTLEASLMACEEALHEILIGKRSEA